MGQGRSLPADRSVAALQCQLLAASLNKLQTGLYKMCTEFVKQQLRIRDAPREELREDY